MLVILTSHPIQYQAPLWRALAKDGRVPFEVWFLTDHAVKPTQDREFGKSFAWDGNLLEGYPHQFLPVRAGWRMDRFGGIHLTEPWAKLFREQRVTRLWVEGWRFRENWAAIFAARRAGIEVWLRGETNDLKARRGLRERGRRLLLARLFSCVRYFLCIGGANRRFYQSFGITDDRLLAAPYGVDNEFFAQKAETLKGQKTEIRKRWGIPEDAFCVLFCGKFIPKKRPMDLVAAARLLLSSISQLQSPSSLPPKLHLLFVGSGELGAQLRASCHIVFDAESSSPLRLKRGEVHEEVSNSAAKYPSSIIHHPSASFTGFLNQSELPTAYVVADCLVLPSDTGETWGLVVNEAMASGLPIIASNQCGCAEDLVRPLSNSAVFPTGDVAALARAIEDQVVYPVPSEKVKEQVANFTFYQTVDSVAAKCVMSPPPTNEAH